MGSEYVTRSQKRRRHEGLKKEQRDDRRGPSRLENETPNEPGSERSRHDEEEKEKGSYRARCAIDADRKSFFHLDGIGLLCKPGVVRGEGIGLRLQASTCFYFRQ
jgi:hypothetical protein